MFRRAWNEVNANPGLAGTILLLVFITVMAWAWLPTGLLLP
jgi:hypothetical protein